MFWDTDMRDGGYVSFVTGFLAASCRTLKEEYRVYSAAKMLNSLRPSFWFLSGNLILPTKLTMAETFSISDSFEINPRLQVISPIQL